MRQLGAEEKAALLLTAADDDDEDDNQELINSSTRIHHDDFPIITKRPKTYHTTTNTHPVLCFILILGAFILGCVSGVTIILYRMSQEAEQPSNILPLATDVDLSIRTKLFQSITKTNFLNFNTSIQSEIDSANKLYEQWQSLSSELIHVNKFSYDIDVSKYTSMKQWSGIQLLDNKNDKEILKINHLLIDNFLSYSSLIKSGTINSNSIYYVNYGREEDFSYLFEHRIYFENPDKSILFMRRKSTIISQTKQIHQAIHYGFGGLVLFDDNDNQQITTTNRHSFFREWGRYSGVKDRENYLDGVLNDKDHSISLLILSFNDVQTIFASLQPDSNQWLSCPNQWHNKSTPLKIGGTLTNFKFRFIVNIEQVKIELPVVMSSIRGIINPEQFIMIGSQLNSIQQNRIMNEIIQAYINQIKNGWKPKRSILFCAWSGFDYDQYTIRRWLSDNFRLINNNLITYIDLGNGILSNSTLNLHGSPLLEQIAHHAADFVVSPLKHDHNCHHRQMMKTTTTTMSNEENHHHDHGRRKRRDSGHEYQMDTDDIQCEPHKLLDEWIRAVHNRFGSNQTLPIVQSIDADSTAALFQLQYGIPALLIEMTDEQALVNDTFYIHHLTSIFDQNIQAEISVAYTQFIIEIIRQLIDEPLISFNLTNYADQIDEQVIQYLIHYDRGYNSLSYHIGERNEFSKLFNDLTKTIRQIQLRIDQTSRNDYIRLQSLNKQLIEFERLFISNIQLPGMNFPDKIYKHILIGPAFGLTNTVVPFPLLSNILYGIPEDPPSELCDGSKVFWLKLKEHIHLINRTLNGFDGLIIKDK